MEITKCNCVYHCNCYLLGKKIVKQRIEEAPGTKYIFNKDNLIIGGAICVITYSTGEVQKLRRAWMDTLESHPIL